MCKKSKWYARIAERLNFLIIYRDIRIEQLAIETEIPKETLERWFSGELTDCNLSSVEKLSKALGMNPEYIIMEAVDEFEKEISDTFRDRKIKV